MPFADELLERSELEIEVVRKQANTLVCSCTEGG